MNGEMRIWAIFHIPNRTDREMIPDERANSVTLVQHLHFRRHLAVPYHPHQNCNNNKEIEKKDILIKNRLKYKASCSGIKFRNLIGKKIQ